MPNTPRLGWPYPAEDQDPWYEPFLAFLTALDATVFAAVEDRNIFLASAATFSWVASSGLLTWDAAIDLTSPISGFKHTLAAGSLVIGDGQMFYVEVTRNPTLNITVTGAVAASQPPSADYETFFALGVRRGSRLYFRNGGFLDTTETRQIFGGHRSAFNIDDVASTAARAALGNGTRYWPLVEGASDTLTFQVRVVSGGSYALRFSYYMAAANAGAVSLRVDHGIYTTGSAPTGALTAGASFTVTPGNDVLLHQASEDDSASLLYTLTEGDLVTFQIIRVDDGSDTHTGDMRVLGITLVPYTVA